MNFFDKIHNLYLDTLEHHDTISIDFSHSNETRKDIMYIVQYHSMVEGFCKRMLEYFCKHIEYAIQKNINRYRNISIIFYRNKNSNNNIIKDPDLLNLNLDTDWIKKKIIDYPLLKNFQLKDGEFEFLFSFLQILCTLKIFQCR